MWEKIFEIAKSERPTIGVGFNRINPEILEIIQKANKFAEVVPLGQ